MILLEFGNQIIIDTLKDRFAPDSEPANLDIKFADFDGVQYHISTTPSSKTELIISIYWKCFGELKSYGAEDNLKNEYKDLVTATEDGYNFSVKVDMTKKPADLDAVIQKISLLKRNALAAPFYKAFDAQLKGQTTDLMQINYRDGEAIFVQGFADRVTVIFETTFKDETDIIFGKVFLQEFVDARRQPGLQNAPQVLYYPKDPPVELKGVKGLKNDDNIGFVTFVLNPRHYEKNKRESAVSLVQTFRDYLHYHIKCSKAYMHSRMRARVESLLKILNRAKPEIQVERNKTASGKSFIKK